MTAAAFGTSSAWASFVSLRSCSCPLESPVTHAEYERVFAIAKAATDALIIADTPENYVNREKIADLARVHRLPAVYPNRNMPELVVW
jgi:putative tryptophan/tyrosine transport system substrate-binding protein